MQWIMAHLSVVLGSVGGVAVVSAYLLKGVDPLIHLAIQAALASPNLHPILIQYRPQILALSGEINKDFKDNLNAAQ